MSTPGNRNAELRTVEASAQPPLVIDIHGLAADDLPFVRHTWRESYKKAPKVDKLTWSLYKQTAGRIIDHLVGREDVQLLGAFGLGGRVLGWIAWTPGRAVSTVHWVYTRHELDGALLRRRGIMTDLWDAAQLGKRIVYTHKGPKRQRSVPMDETLVDWCRSRGVTATHVSVEEFLK